MGGLVRQLAKQMFITEAFTGNLSYLQDVSIRANYKDAEKMIPSELKDNYLIFENELSDTVFESDFRAVNYLL